MLVKNVTHNILDVFFDKGFENWSRVQVVKKKTDSGLIRTLEQVAGKTLPPEIFTYLKRRLGAS